MSRKHYEENFKKQIVNIYNQGNHTYRSLSEEYGVAMSLFPIEGNTVLVQCASY